jgi:hypothetical protein
MMENICPARFHHLSLPKGEGRARVRQRNTVQREPLTSILSPSQRGEADCSARVGGFTA